MKVNQGKICCNNLLINANHIIRINNKPNHKRGELIMDTNIDKIYENDFKSQPLYSNKFNLDDKERAKYLEMVPAWFKKWQEELDKIY